MNISEDVIDQWDIELYSIVELLRLASRITTMMTEGEMKYTLDEIGELRYLIEVITGKTESLNKTITASAGN